MTAATYTHDSTGRITLRSLLAIRPGERCMMAAVLLLLVALNALTIAKYQGVLTPLSDHYWNLFVGKFHVSGFDPISYYVVSDWEARYNVYRHPLLAFFMWVPYLVNQVCIALTGVNCALYIMCVMQVAAAWYAFLFMYRILTDVVGLATTDARLLTAWLYSFAFVMVTAMVPDHFVFSFCILLLALYLSGLLIQRHLQMPVLTAVVLFAVTAGISLNNGLKVFMADLAVRGRGFFRLRFLLPAVIVPAALIWIGSRYEYHYLVAPGENARHAATAKRKAVQQRQDSLRMVALAAQSAADSVQGKSVAAPAKQAVKAKRPPKKGAPLMQGEFMRWTDVTTPRWQSVVENLMGESIQLHPDYLLQDEYRSRPMIVRYRWAANYVAEAVIAALFLLGVWMGRHSRFMWLCLSWFGLDMLLHVVLGFGLNEVYIMTAHWIYVMPIAVAYLIQGAPRARMPLRALIAVLAVALYAYNGYFIVKYMLC